jgi:hypothetical protein
MDSLADIHALLTYISISTYFEIQVLYYEAANNDKPQAGL